MPSSAPVLNRTCSAHGYDEQTYNDGSTQNDHPIGNLNARYECSLVKPVHYFSSRLVRLSWRPLPASGEEQSTQKHLELYCAGIELGTPFSWNIIEVSCYFHGARPLLPKRPFLDQRASAPLPAGALFPIRHRQCAQAAIKQGPRKSAHPVDCSAAGPTNLCNIGRCP